MRGLFMNNIPLNFAIPADRVAGLLAGMDIKNIELFYLLQQGIVVKRQFPNHEVGAFEKIGLVELNDNR